MDKTTISRLVAAQNPLNGIYRDIVPINGDGGPGHFSVVFRATHIPTSRQVALKFYLDRGDAYRRECFEREGKLLSGALKGEEEFVQLVDAPGLFGIEATTAVGPLKIEIPFLSFEWMQHGNAGALAKSPPSDQRSFFKRIRHLREMNRCVHRLHFLQCRHRDLKPDNFFLGRGKRVRLGDFGTSRLYTAAEPPILSSYGFAPGDLGYTAIEAMAGLDIDSAGWAVADMYSLGAIFFELITGIQFASVVFGRLHKIKEFVSRMSIVPHGNRKSVLHSIVDGQDWPLEKMRHYNPGIPRCAVPYLDELIPDMLRLDYRRRTLTSERIDRQLRCCEIVVFNEIRTMHRQRRRGAL